MFDIHNHAGKRVMAMLLVFAMMFAMLGEYAPSWFRAYAEEMSEDSGSSSSEDRSSDHHESSHSDSGSSSSHKTSHLDSGSSSSYKSSHSDGGSSSSHKSSHSDRGSLSSYISSHSDDDSSSSHKSSHAGRASSGSHESSASDNNVANDTPKEPIVWQDSDVLSPSEDTGSENAQNKVSVENVEVTSGDGNTSEDSVVSETNEDGAADESIPVVVWGSSGDDNAADPMETGTEPSEKLMPVETEGEPTEVGKDGSAPSGEIVSLEGAMEEGKVPAEETDPVMTSGDENTSGDSVVSETNEDGAADDSIPVVVWGSSGDENAADPMETGTAPSEKPAPVETEGEPTEVDTGDSAPSEENLPPEAAKEEIEVPAGETDPVDGEAAVPDDGAASEEIAPVEGKEEQTEVATDDAEADDPGTVLTLTAALSPADENSELAADKAEVSENEPVFTMQAYTVPVMLAANGAEEEKVCLLQRKINDVMQTAGDTLSGRIRVVLEKNTTYDGEVNIDNGGRKVADDFELEVSSVDAGSDGMQADGTTIFTGNMTIRGISVKIAGVGLPGTVTVDSAKAKLDYYGTRADDGANVTVTGEGAEAALHTGEGADAVNVQAQNGGAATVDAGTGADTVTAAVSGSGSRTGDGHRREHAVRHDRR